jgi:hypothetical protein
LRSDAKTNKNSQNSHSRAFATLRFLERGRHGSRFDCHPRIRLCERLDAVSRRYPNAAIARTPRCASSIILKVTSNLAGSLVNLDLSKFGLKRWNELRVPLIIRTPCSRCQAARLTAAVFPFSKSRSPNPICGALGQSQLAFAIETRLPPSRNSEIERQTACDSTINDYRLALAVL